MNHPPEYTNKTILEEHPIKVVGSNYLLCESVSETQENTHAHTPKQAIQNTAKNDKPINNNIYAKIIDNNIIENSEKVLEKTLENELTSDSPDNTHTQKVVGTNYLLHQTSSIPLREYTSNYHARRALESAITRLNDALITCYSILQHLQKIEQEPKPVQSNHTPSSHTHTTDDDLELLQELANTFKIIMRTHPSNPFLLFARDSDLRRELGWPPAKFARIRNLALKHGFQRDEHRLDILVYPKNLAKKGG